MRKLWRTSCLHWECTCGRSESLPEHLQITISTTCITCHFHVCTTFHSAFDDSYTTSLVSIASGIFWYCGGDQHTTSSDTHWKRSRTLKTQGILVRDLPTSAVDQYEWFDTSPIDRKKRSVRTHYRRTGGSEPKDCTARTALNCDSLLRSRVGLIIFLVVFRPTDGLRSHHNHE